MAYLTKDEFTELGFVSENFDENLKRAELAINLFIRHYYDFHDFDKDHKTRKKAVKLATAYQIAYLDSTGILTAEDKQSIASVKLGRTEVSYGSQERTGASGYNLSIDAFNALKSVGFLYRGVSYGRY